MAEKKRANQAQQTTIIGNTMASVVGQVGCVTVLLIGAALFGGIALDNLLGLETRIFTIVFLVGSAPVALYLVTRLALRSIAHAQDQLDTIQSEDHTET